MDQEGLWKGNMKEKKQRTFVATDTHGYAAELKNCLEQAEFDYKVDKLIHLGDVVDRGPDSKGVVDLLLSIDNRVCVRGNHDEVFRKWIYTGRHDFQWLQGGQQTIDSYVGKQARYMTKLDIPKTHIEFFDTQVSYYVDDQNRLFVHGGYDRHTLISEQDPHQLFWNRELFGYAANVEEFVSESPIRLFDVNKFSRVFIGHTTTTDLVNDDGSIKTVPLYGGQVVGLDTGKCYGGKISLIDITDDAAHVLYQA